MERLLGQPVPVEVQTTTNVNYWIHRWWRRAFTPGAITRKVALQWCSRSKFLDEPDQLRISLGASPRDGRSFQWLG